MRSAKWFQVRKREKETENVSKYFSMIAIEIDINRFISMGLGCENDAFSSGLFDGIEKF